MEMILLLPYRERPRRALYSNRREDRTLRFDCGRCSGSALVEEDVRASFLMSIGEERFVSLTTPAVAVAMADETS